MSAWLSKITIGPEHKGYVYTPVGPDLWKCAKAADNQNAPEGHVLWLIRMQPPDEGWLAVHAPAECTATDQVRTQGTAVFRSLEPNITAPGDHNWDWWDRELNSWRAFDWTFRTTRG